MTEAFMSVLRRERVVAIVRSTSAERAIRLADELATNGVPLVEVTLNTPGALDAIAATRAVRADGGPGAGVPVGAGTVLTPEDARAAVSAGAEFLVTPAVIDDVLAEAATMAVPVLCGAFTATEALHAWSAGAAAIKLFPAGYAGPGYLAALRGPLPDIPLVPVGDVALEIVPDYLEAGAIGVGLGGTLIGDGTGLADRCAHLRSLL